jgi:hypothetical protein
MSARAIGAKKEAPNRGGLRLHPGSSPGAGIFITL